MVKIAEALTLFGIQCDNQIFLIRLAARFLGGKRCPGCGIFRGLFCFRPIWAKDALEVPFSTKLVEGGEVVFVKVEGYHALRWQAFEVRKMVT